MEIWEQQKFQRCLPLLLKLLRSNISLLAELENREIISQNDVAEISSKASDYDKNYALIQIVQSRTGGYQAFLDALKETKQNGVVHLLEPRTSFSEDSPVSPTSIQQPAKASLEMSPVNDEISPIQIKWENSLRQKWELFRKKVVAEDAAAEVMTTFYSEEMKLLLHDNKYVGPNVLSEFHRQVYSAMKNGLHREAAYLPDLTRLLEILSQISKTNEKKFILSMNGNPNFGKPPAIGIDLGTCNCCVAVFINGTVKIILNNSGDKTTPSFVEFRKGQETVGKTARKLAFRNCQYTIYDSKRMVGRSFDDPELQKDKQIWPFKVINDNGAPKILVSEEMSMSPVDISTKLLKECVKLAEQDLQQPVTRAVITVPAYFNNSQLEATMEAGKKAGLDVLGLLKEPSAAALMYTHERNFHVARRVLIFDMGGGTFDVAIADINNDLVDILGICGDTHLGGEDFDQRIMNFCIEEFTRMTDMDINTFANETTTRRILSKLKFSCEDAKKDLSSAQDVEIVVCEDPDVVVELSRQKFEDLSKDLFDKMIEIVNKLLTDTNNCKEDVQDVILVGGSTRIPKLKQLLSEYFDGKPLNNSTNQDYAVAYGAAIHAASLNGEDLRKHLMLGSIKDVIPMPIGIQVIRDDTPGKFAPIIKKNSKYPDVYKETYYTHRDNQESAKIKVFQGEHDDVKQNFYIGEFRFEGIPKAPKGKETIEVCMTIDKSGILNVTANCRGKSGPVGLTVKLSDSGKSTSAS